MRTYTELIQFPTFLERYNYLRIGGKVGWETFGFDRWLNQQFYKSPEWKALRDFVITRDAQNADWPLDLASPEAPIVTDWLNPVTGRYEHTAARILVHHMNPITKDDILGRSKVAWDPEFLITTSEATHNAIHYGDESLLAISYITERAPNDTIPWR